MRFSKNARTVFSIDFALTLIRGVTVPFITRNGLKLKITLRILLAMVGLNLTRTPILFRVAVTIKASLWRWQVSSNGGSCHVYIPRRFLKHTQEPIQ